MEIDVFSVYSIPTRQLDHNKHIHATDEQLLEAYRSTGDNRLLGELLQRYTLLLLGVGIKYLKDKETAQDAVQQVFLKAITHLPKEEIQNFKGWLYVLMRNHCLQLLRDKRYLTDEKQLNELQAVTIDKEELEWKDATIEQMQQALAQLDEEQKTTITMFYLQKMSYKQIMDKTGYSFAQVKSYIQNGKRKLKLILTRQTK